MPKKYVIYEVKQGDTLWQLAKEHMPNLDPRYGCCLIKKANGMPHDYVIQPGDILNVPSVYGLMEEPLGPVYASEIAAREREQNKQ